MTPETDNLLPVDAIWPIQPERDTPDQLRAQIGQMACAIAKEFGKGNWIQQTDTGIGFVYQEHNAAIDNDSPALSSHPVVAMLQMCDACTLLSDQSLIRFFRLLRLIHRLGELTPELTDDSKEP